MEESVKITTTWPVPDATTHGILTDRLLLRPFLPSDLAALTALRSDPEVMLFSPSGRPADAPSTKRFLEGKLAAPRALDYVVCLRDTGQAIGVCGVSGLERGGVLGWPSVGYQMLRGFWGRGYATEAVGGLVRGYWEVRRGVREVFVEPSTQQQQQQQQQPEEQEECLSAITVEENAGSRRVLEKNSFSLVKVWEDVDLRDRSKTVRLCGYVARRT